MVRGVALVSAGYWCDSLIVELPRLVTFCRALGH